MSRLEGKGLTGVLRFAGSPCLRIASQAGVGLETVLCFLGESWADLSRSPTTTNIDKGPIWTIKTKETHKNNEEEKIHFSSFVLWTAFHCLNDCNSGLVHLDKDILIFARKFPTWQKQSRAASTFNPCLKLLQFKYIYRICFHEEISYSLFKCSTKLQDKEIT